MDRRQFLAATSTALGASLGGCLTTNTTVERDQPDDQPASSASEGDDPPATISSDSTPGLDGEESDGASNDDSTPTADEPDESDDTSDVSQTNVFRQASDPWGNTQRERIDGGVRRTMDVALGSGRYAVYTLRPQRATKYSVSMELEGSDESEFFVMDRREFDRFRSGRRFSVYPALSADGGSPAASGTLAPGEYTLVFDNTQAGDVPPYAFIDASVELTAMLG